jgi:hypothetical protein
LRIEEYLKNASITVPGMFYSDMASLISKTLASGAYPSATPFPPSYNVLTGRYAGDLNSFRLELYARSRGYDRALWITSADASFFSLRPKHEKHDPFFTAFRTPKDKLNCQYLYLMDSFTPESLTRLYSFVNPVTNASASFQKHAIPPSLLDARNVLAEKILFSLTAHDAGNPVTRERLAGTYLRNMSPDSDSFFLTKNAHKTYLANIPAPYKKVFEYLRKYRTQQLTSLSILGNSAIDDDTKKSFDLLSKDTSKGNLPSVVFYSWNFAAQLCRNGQTMPQPVPAPAVSKRNMPGKNIPAPKDTSIDAFIMGG